MERGPRQQLECHLPPEHKSVESTLSRCLLPPVCQVMSACRSTNQLGSVCLCTTSLTPQHASSCTRRGGWGVVGGWVRGLRTTAACWNNRAAEMTAPHGSHYPAGLLIGAFDCSGERIARSTVARSHVTDGRSVDRRIYHFSLIALIVQR